MIEKIMQCVFFIGLVVFNINSFAFRLLTFNPNIFEAIRGISGVIILIGAIYYMYYYAFFSRFPSFKKNK